jgi:putative ABC transport system permease protein
MLRHLRAGFRALLRRDWADRETSDEIRHYLEMAVDERVRAGMPPEAAARAARAEMGSIAAVTEQVRSAGWEAHVETWWRDLRYAFRGARRNPGFTAVVILTLALGTGANTVMFSVVNAVALRPLPYADSDRLVLIWTDDVRRALHRESTAYLTITEWSTRNRALGEIAFFTSQRVAPMTNDPATRGRARSALVSANLLPLLGIQPLLGRAISAADEAQHAAVVVISHGFWHRWFGGDPAVVGRTLAMDDGSKGGVVTATVVGVMPPGFYFPDKQTELWTPAVNYWRFVRESRERFPQSARRWTAVARLNPGVSVADARADMARVGGDLSATYPSDVPDFPGFATTVVPVLDAIAGTDLRSALWLLLGATALVLLIACANVANLLLARGASRQHEFAVRRALGGGRGRLMRQLAIEHVVLASAGGLAGLAIAEWSIRLVKSATALYLPRIDELSLDVRVLVVAGLASLASAVVFGIAPAVRLSAANPASVLQSGTRATASPRLRRTRGLIVLAECALAVVVLAGAGLLLRSLNRVLAIDPGFDPAGVLVARLEFPSEPPPTREERTQTSSPDAARARRREQSMQDLLARLQTLPGVRQTAFADDLYINNPGNESIAIPSRSPEPMTVELNTGSVTPDFFPLMRVPILRGRLPLREDTIQKIRALWSPVLTHLSLEEKERRAIPEPVVVNESFARRFFPGDDPVGKRFCVDPTNKTYWYEIVGVVGDMHRQGLEQRTIAEYFGPYFPAAGSRGDLLVRADGNPLALAGTIGQEVLRALPGVSVAQVSTADGQLADFSARRRLQTWLLTAFAVLAISLAGIGIFGLAHYTIAERTHEIGVRIVLGAKPRDVLGLLVIQGMRMPAAGIGIGLAAAAALTRLMSHLLFGVTATDPATFSAAAAALAGVAAFASSVAARRSTRLDPLRALRES